ncbi:nucleotide-diphospho-sugar transferase [Microthyrium microscopicum]|uniref:Mannose-1-phosphate guanyltransferase n=1 Tax=Microthyrium microscopicum TaxID=703497 RepID=A0A6A6UFG4_9PEZI|nr:nucleotide-diphospho-sugar transferase [Microthyrium microscopicum]
MPAHSQKPEDEHDDPLQAVILTDCHENRFMPLTMQTPRCLLNLANIPLIDYTLHFLASAGVEHVYIVTSHFHEEVESHLETAGWNNDNSHFSRIECIRSQSESVGGVMRDLDQYGVLKNDFVVVYGDLISNLPLEEALSAHKKRREADKDAIMTMVLRESGTGSDSRREKAPVFVIDPKNDRCVHYEDMSPDKKEHFVSLDPDLLHDHQDMDIRADLIDCEVDIYTPDVLALWTDNFDFQTARQNFLYSVLKDYELNGKKIFTHVTTDYYAARARNLREYDTISKAIIERWVYPWTPDNNLCFGYNYQMTKGFRYKELDVRLARSCQIGPKTMIGNDTSAGEGTVIIGSVVGRRCIIGNNVTIENAYIWDDTVIRDGSHIKQAIVAKGCTIGKKCIIEPGALIATGVQVADNTTVKSSSRLTCIKRKRDDSGDFEPVTTDTKVVGVGGKGTEYSPDPDDEDEEDASLPHGLVYNLSHLTFSTESFSDPDDSFSDTSDIDPSQGRRNSTAGSIISLASDDDTSASERKSEIAFHNEAVAQLTDSLAKGDASDNMQLELTSLRMVTQASEHAMRRAIVASFMRHISSLVSDGTSIASAVTSTIKPHQALLNRNIFDKEKASKVDQVDLLLLLQSDLSKRLDGDAILLRVTHELVNLDVVEAEGIEQWWNDERSVASKEVTRLREKTRQLVDYLLRDSSEDEDDEDEDESD